MYFVNISELFPHLQKQYINKLYKDPDYRLWTGNSSCGGSFSACGVTATMEGFFVNLTEDEVFKLCVDPRRVFDPVKRAKLKQELKEANDDRADAWILFVLGIVPLMLSFCLYYSGEAIWGIVATGIMLVFFICFLLIRWNARREIKGLKQELLILDGEAE